MNSLYTTPCTTIYAPPFTIYHDAHESCNQGKYFTPAQHIYQARATRPGYFLNKGFVLKQKSVKESDNRKAGLQATEALAPAGGGAG